MKKKDLRTGMQVEQRNGTRKVVLLDTKSGNVIVRVNGSEHGDLGGYNNDLTCGHDEQFDIMKVYSSYQITDFLIGKFDEDEIIWQRNPSIEINVKINGKETTLKDISEETLLSIRNEC